ncbi:MAG TPA: vWA domain-containing protein, partial [Polyangiaceae bacterium]|nr:vWA domain-containing protein [Polyangiaceae bacterium]
QDLTVVPTPQVPTVAIVVDNSSSMYEPRAELWDRLYDAMMNPTTGAIKPLEGKVRFGFSSFRSPQSTSVPETNDACAQIVNVPYALDNFDEINTVYQGVGLDGRRPAGCGATPNASGCGETSWETPTGHSLRRIAAALGTFTADPPGKKYMLFVTDGTPNTCQVANPNCGQDLALKAIQDAQAAGIGTFVIGIGDILATNSGCNTGSMRCGRDHLQDIANAGAGQPVAPPPMAYWYEQCATIQSGTSPGTPVATYAASGQTPGTATYYTAMSAAELRTALTTLLTDVVSCTIELDATVNATADPGLARVTLAGTAVPYNTADGWILETTRDKITLQGAACVTFRGGASVNVVFPCQNGRPIGT